MNIITTVASVTGYLRQYKNRIAYQVLFLFLFILVPGYLCAETYYVDASNGDDNNLGTQETWAWKTVDKVNKRSFIAGDTILFKRDELWNESLVIPSSGTASQPITFGAYGTGDRPLLDGTYTNFPFVTQWQHIQGNIYKTTQPPWNNTPGLLIYKGQAKPPITTLQFSSSVPIALNKGAILLQKDVHYTNLWVTSTSGNTVSGITFFNIYEDENIYVRQLNASGQEEDWINTIGTPTKVNSQDSLTEPGHWYWNEPEKSVYLYADAAPNLIDVKLGKLMIGINSAHRNFITIQDIAVHGFTQTGVLITGTEGAVVQNMHVSSIGASGSQCGILLNNSKNNLVQNNTVESILRVGIGIYAVNTTPFSHGNAVTGNTIINSGATGISLNTDGQLIANTVEDNFISGNIVLNSNALSYDSAGIYTLFVGGGNVIRSNTIKNGGSTELRSSGIMIEGGVTSVIKPVTIENNIIESNSLAGIAVSGEGHRITGNTLRNNGVPSWENAQIIFFASFGKNASNCTVTNNTMAAGANQTLISVLNGFGSGSPPHTINNNRYCSTNPEPFCWSTWECSNPLNFDTWKIQSGHDGASTFNAAGCSASNPGNDFEKNISGVYLLLLK